MLLGHRAEERHVCGCILHGACPERVIFRNLDSATSLCDPYQKLLFWYGGDELSSPDYLVSSSPRSIRPRSRRPHNGPIDTDLKSPEAYRQQVKMLFLDAEFPPGTLLRQKLSAVYAEWFEPRGPAMKSAVNCVLLLYLSRISGDLRRSEMERYHASAIRQLSREMRTPGADQRDNTDNVLGTIESLAIAAQFHELAPDDEYWQVKSVETCLRHC